MVLRSIRFSLLFVFFMNLTQTIFSALDEFKARETDLKYQISLVDSKIIKSTDVIGCNELQVLQTTLEPLQKEFNRLVSQLKCFYQANLPLLIELEIEEEIIPTKEEFKQAVELSECLYKYQKRMDMARRMAALYYDVSFFIKDPKFREKQEQVELAFQSKKNTYNVAESLFKKEQYQRIFRKRKELNNIL